MKYLLLIPLLAGCSMKMPEKVYPDPVVYCKDYVEDQEQLNQAKSDCREISKDLKTKYIGIFRDKESKVRFCFIENPKDKKDVLELDIREVRGMLRYRDLK